jgi:prolyl-tRNA synthetase
MSTRVIGGVLMAHGDDRGAIFPPIIAPVQVAIVPVPGRDEASSRAVEEAATTLHRELTAAGFRVAVDDRPGLRPGAKFFHWERRGAPLRLEIGPRDVAAGQAVAATRHDGQKRPIPFAGAVQAVRELLNTTQAALLVQARENRAARTRVVDDRATLEEAVAQGYALARWCERRACAEEIQTQTRATIRCYPFEGERGDYRPLPDDPGPCAWCAEPATKRVIIARSY